MSLWSYNSDVMDALIELIISLVLSPIQTMFFSQVFVAFFSLHILQAVSNGKYLHPCLDMLVCNFTPPRKFVEALKLPYGVTKKENVLVRVHSALVHITGLVPLAPLSLWQIVHQRTPKVLQNIPGPVSSKTLFLWLKGKLY